MNQFHGPALFLVLLQGAWLPAQDLEPTLDRAAGRVVAGLARHLLTRSPAPEALRLLPSGGPAAAAAAAVRAALVAEGYRLVDAPSAGDGVLPPAAGGGVLAPDAGGGVLELQAWSDPGRPHSVLVVETVGVEPARFVSRYSDAAWVDQGAVAAGDGAPADRLVVESGVCRTAGEALESARRRAEGLLLHRAGWGPATAPAPRSGRGKLRVGRTFVGETTADDARAYRAWLEVPSPARQAADLARVLERESRRRAVAPWLRGAATLVLAAAIGLGYLGADLKTRGYMTGRLRALFGILFLVGAGLCWRLPW